MSEKIEKLAQDLIGTCKSISDFLEDDELTLEEAHELDDLVLECVNCNWWSEPGEIGDRDGEHVCLECLGE